MANVSLNWEAAAVKEIGGWLFLKQVQIIAEPIKMNKSRAIRDIFCGGLYPEICEMFLNRYGWSQRKNCKTF